MDRAMTVLRVVAVLILAVLVGMATAHFNFTASGLSRDRITEGRVAP